jgi:hypothetical protein
VPALPAPQQQALVPRPLVQQRLALPRPPCVPDAPPSQLAPPPWRPALLRAPLPAPRERTQQA